MADLNLEAGTNMSIRQEDTDLYLDNTYEYDDTQIQQDLLTRSLITETGNIIELTLNNTNYKMTAILKNKYGTVISTSNEIDLPIESLVVSIYYDSTTKELVFVLKDGTTTRVPLLDLIDGLATEEDLETLEDNVNNTIQTFEDDINEDMETFKGDVEQELEKAQQDLSMYKMLENALPKVEGEGETIHLEDTAQCPMKMDFKGQIQQVSTTGKNIIDLTQLFQRNSGATTSNMLANSVTINGTSAWGNTYFYIPNTSKNTDYTASCKVISSLARKSGISIYGASDTSGTGLTSINSVQGDISANVSKKYVNSFNSGNYEYIVLRLWNNATATALGSNVELNISEIQLELGTIETPIFEIYTGNSPSPSPSYPQDIHIVSGDNEIKVQNKNLTLKNVKGYFGSNSILIDNSSESFVFYATQGETYTFSSQTAMNRGQYAKVETLNIVNNTPISNKTSLSIASSYNSATFTCSFTGYCIVYVNSTVNNAIAETFQIEKGSTATDFVEHKEYTKEINLGVKNLFDKDNANILNAYLTGYQIVGYATNHLIYIPVKSGETFTISKKIGNSKLAIAYTTSTPTIGGTTLGVTNTGASLYTTIAPNNATYLCVFVYGSADSTFTLEEILSGIEIVYGDKPQYVSDNPIEVGGIGNYEDEFFKNTIDSEYYDSTLEKDKWYLKKRIGKKVLDGSETWTTSNTNTTNVKRMATTAIQSYVLSPTSSSQTPNILSYYYLPKKADDTYQKNVGISLSNSGIVLIYDSTYNADDTSLYKAWLGTHNLTIYYVLATPTNTILNDTLQETLDSFYSWQEQTNIMQDNNDLPFVIKASAIYDLTNLVNRVATLETE